MLFKGSVYNLRAVEIQNQTDAWFRPLLNALCLHKKRKRVINKTDKTIKNVDTLYF